MLGGSAKTASSRIIGALLFVAVFFLPLHFHAAPTATEMSTECSCAHGTRTQSGLAPVSTDCTPCVYAISVSLSQPQYSAFYTTLVESIRAPPLF
jgi:hypothetical protein